MSTIFDLLGTKPAINARGIYTDLGGSRLSSDVMRVVEESNRHFVNMVDLLDGSGVVLAEMLGAEAARVTPSASSAIALGIAACMTGTDGAKMEQLPDTTGMRDAVLIQKRHRYKYDRMVRLPGARLIEVGDENGTSAAELEAAIGDDTAAICFPAHMDSARGPFAVEHTVSLDDTLAIAKRHGVPTLVDAAYMNYPVDLLSSYPRAGADLTCFSAKYFGGPNAGAFICGRRELMDAVAGVDFTRFESGEHLIFGRAFKLDRQSVVATVVALQEWMDMDHDARFRSYRALVDDLAEQIRGVNVFTTRPIHWSMDDSIEPEPVNALLVQVSPEASCDAAEIQARLAAGNPAILAHCAGDAVVIDVEVVAADEIPTIAAGLKAALD